MEDCIFCRIVAGDIPAEVVYQDETVFAFLDISPVNKGHVLIVPKQHMRNIFDATEKEITPLYLLAQRIAHAQVDALHADGVNISNNNESAAGQEVFHYHVHVIPRFEDDGLTHWPKVEYGKGEEHEIGTQLSSYLTKSD